MLLGSLMERSRIVALAGLGIRVELGVLLVEEKRMVLRQPPRSQMPFEVDHVIFVVVYSFYLHRE